MDQLPVRLRELQAKNNWAVADMAERTGIPKRTPDKYLLRVGASLTGLEALCSLSKGLDVSLDWLVFGIGQPGERTELIACKAAYDEVFDALLRRQAEGAGQPRSEEFYGMRPEEWAAEVGCRAGERAKSIPEARTTMEDLLVWREGLRDRLIELVRERAAEITAAKEKP